MEDVVIVGAGIGGLATAIALKRVGVRALVLERSTELRTTGAAITLAPNAWIALDALGVSKNLAARYRPIEGATVTDVKTGTTQNVPFEGNKSSEGHKIRSVHRKVLLRTLADELPPNSIRFSSKLKTMETLVEQGLTVCVLQLEDGSIIKAKVVIGCDGVHSVVGRKLGLHPPADSGRSAVRGLAVFPEPHGFNNAVHQWVGESIRVIWVTLNDKEVYWGLTYKTPINGETMSNDPDQIKKHVIGTVSVDLPPSFLDIVYHSDPSTLSWSPLMFRYPWHVIFGNLGAQNMTVVGDAMHPMTPDLGQGGCLALEDAVVLGRHIAYSMKDSGKIESKNVGWAIKKYVAERRWRAAMIITMSFLSGWFQQDGSNWVRKFLRDSVFYKLLLSRIPKIIHYDCGKLPIKME